VLNIGEGIAADLIGLLLIVVIAGIVWWVAKAVMKQAVVAIVISVVAGVAMAWVMFAGGLEFLVGETQGEATELGNRTTSEIPYNFGP
jgi:hypothetical protein